MKHTKKCSALLAAGAGAAVCLSGGPAQAISGLTGPILASMSSAPAFSGAIVLGNAMGVYFGGNGPYSTQVAVSGPMVATYGPGINCETGTFTQGAQAPAGGPDRFVKIRFNNGTQYYGWTQFTNNAGVFELGAWSYMPVGAGIPTLADSVKAQKLGLADGREKLVWSNANEEGVARYEVQAKDAAGVWSAVSSEVPGAGMYSIAVPKGGECRVVLEKVDGTTEGIAF